MGSYKDKMTLEGQNGLQIFLQWSINDRRHLGVGDAQLNSPISFGNPIDGRVVISPSQVQPFNPAAFSLYILIIPCLFYCSKK